MSGTPSVAACRIHPDDTQFDPAHNLLTRQSTITFGEPCGPAPQAPPPGPPPRPAAGAVVGVRIRKKQHNKKLKLEVGSTTGALKTLEEDRKVTKALNGVFGTFHADEVWVGFRYDGVIVGPKPQLKSRLTITFQPRKNKKKGFQLLPWAFAYGGDFGRHHLLGISVLKLGQFETDPHASVCVEHA